jgi:hypothetical protein
MKNHLEYQTTQWKQYTKRKLEHWLEILPIKW